ncbi:MAG: hypothetical protein PHF51_02120 [Candidatus ainarchaeum sp.]|nr:hypothetical protein [Candidatus ainarchaeum sp.]
MGVNICVAGSKSGREEFCRSLGKKGSSDDFTFYNTSYSGKRIHLIEPTAYPGKIDSLIDSVALSDFTVLVVGEINAEFGETVLILDLMSPKGFFVTDADISQYVKGTSLENWKRLGMEAARRAVLEELKPEEKTGEPLVLVDHSFEVKGVGSVLLGVVKSGGLCVHDRLISNPGGQALEVRSIQKNDVEEKEAGSSDRIGLAIKGLTSKEVHRGAVLSKSPLPSASEIPQSSVIYSKFAAKDSKTLHAYHCLQSSPCRVEGGKIVFEKPIALVPGQPLILCDLNRKMRAVGKAAF